MDCLVRWCRNLVQLWTVREWLVHVMATLIIILIIFRLKSWVRAVRLAFGLPGPPALPLLGNILEVKDSEGFIRLARTVNQKYGSLFRGWLTVLPLIIVLDPKHLQRVLGSSKHTNKNFLYSFMHTFIGEGLITSNGHKWKSHRKYIQPYFDINTLAMFVQTFSESAQCMVEQLRDQEDVKITTYVNRCILDILHQAILGIPIKEQEVKRQSPFTKGHVMITERVLRPWLLLDFLYKFTSSAKKEVEQKLTMQEFAEKILEERRRDKVQGKVTQWCLLDVLMEIAESNADFTDKDIIDEVCTFMLAGQDSVGAAVAFTLYYLAKHPDIQEKVAEEVNQIFLTSATLNVALLSKLKYLEQCIREAMRLCPSVPIIARKLSEDVKLDDHTLPAGCNIFISPYATHRLPDYYPDPEKFDPDRFSGENREKRNTFAYIPFSAGPRNCLGYKFAMLEMQTVVAIFLRNYKVSVVPGYELEIYYRVTLRARGGVQLRLQPRQSS